MTSVAVIGGSGRLGRYIVNELSPTFEVLVFDQSIIGGPASAKMVDITVLDDLRGALGGVDAIVHVAGIDGHVEASQETFFKTNVLGTWNVLQASAELGIRKIVITSSTSATGLSVVEPVAAIEYLPIDEDHPLFPIDAYGLGKQLNEVTGASFGRRTGMQVICIRPTYIAFPELVPHLAGETNTTGDVPAVLREPRPRLRTYVDPRDLARCYRLALAFEPKGFHLFWANAADTFEEMPTLDYLKSVHCELPEIRRPKLYADNPHAAVIDCSRAATMLGWKPEITWPELSRCRR